MSLADQKVETSHERVFFNKAETHPIQRWNLGFWSQCHLVIKSWRHPTLKAATYFFEVIVTWWLKVGDTPHPKLEPSFLKSVSLADQKLETPLIQSWNIGFWSQFYLLIKRWRHALQRVFSAKAETPPIQSWKLGFGSQCHLLIKRWRQSLERVFSAKVAIPQSKAGS